jgi:glycogen debranching enzyme
MVGRDGVRRQTRVAFTAPPDDLRAEGRIVHATFRLTLGPYQTKTIGLTIEPVTGRDVPPKLEFDAAVHRLRRSYEEWERASTNVVTDNELFNELLDRSLRDLRALYTRTGDGHIVAAGIPWYVTVFGRDSLIASHQLLSINASPARETLTSSPSGRAGGRLA